MKKTVILVAIFVIILTLSMRVNATMVFSLDFGQDGTYDDTLTDPYFLLPCTTVKADLYVSNLPEELSDGSDSEGLLGYGFMLEYDSSAVEITSATHGPVFPKNMNKWDNGSNNWQSAPVDATALSGELGMKGGGLTPYAGVNGYVKLASIEFHCIRANGITDLVLYDSDKGGPVGDFAITNSSYYPIDDLDADVSNGVVIGKINQVPIPGAFLLMLSGLLGLVGLKRKS